MEPLQVITFESIKVDAVGVTTSVLGALKLSGVG